MFFFSPTMRKLYGVAGGASGGAADPGVFFPAQVASLVVLLAVSLDLRKGPSVEKVD